MTINESDKLGGHNGFHGAAFTPSGRGFPSGPGNATNELSEKEPLSEQEQRRQLKYWTDQLLPSRPAEFICDMTRPETLSGHVDEETLRIEGSLYNKMQQYCESHEVSHFIVLLAAFRAAHYRLTGMEDATIGVPKEGHQTGDSRNVADTLHRFQCYRLIIDDETFQDLVDQIGTTAANMRANRDISMEKVAARLDEERDFLRQPLLQVTFSFYTQDTPPPKTPASYNTDLSFQIFGTHNSLECCAVFSTDLYEKGTVNNILSIFQKTLEGCLYAPTTPIKEITLLGTKDFETLNQMGLLRAERTDYPRELSVVDVFQQQVSANPTGVAIRDRSGSATYLELDESSNKIASWLSKQSLAPETLIGVLSSRCSETIIAFMGILKANLAYLPLDTKTPEYRMKSIVSCMTGRKIIFLGPETEVPNDLGEIEYVRISQVLHDTDENKDILCELTGYTSSSATSLAHVLFTSGSTGKPKGVMIDHRGIVRLAKSNIMTYVPSRGIIAHMSNIAFDAATWEIYSAILNGGTLVCIDETTVLDYGSMSETFIRENVQTALITTALFKSYAQNAPEIVSHLSVVFIGGERLDINDLPTALKAMPGKIVNLYGPTENTTVSTMYCLQETKHCSNGVPIGRAISNSGAIVMDSKQCLVPLGVIGELVVFGDGLARGYLDPKLDDGHFTPIRIGNEVVRGYRTGDHVRQRLDGQLEFLRRIDGQVKIRGQRVELREVECALRGHKLVHDAVAVLLHGASNGNSDNAHIAGFVTIGADLEDEAQDGDEHQLVSTWKDRYDGDSYTGFDNIQTDAYGRDFTGWTSMFDGKDIDKAKMNEWLDDTIATIATVLNSEPPGHVLEVGSGSGMILFNIRDGLQSYVGLDPSERAINLIGKISKSFPELDNKVTMYKATAADIRRLEMATHPDLVILNSVAQHFPSQEYLYRFVEDLLQLGSDMTLFFGDIRSYALHKDFLAARVLRTVGEEVKLSTIRHMVEDMEKAELELLVDPAFFTGLALRLPDRIGHVEIIPKKMNATNELSCYRYTAVVHVKAGSHQASGVACKQHVRHIPQSDWVDFMKHRLDRESLLLLLRASLDSSAPTSTLAISNIPYTKTILERHMVESIKTDKSDDFDGNWVSCIRQRSEHCSHLSVTDLHALAEEVGCSVEISWARQYSQRGGLDAVFHKYAQDKRGKRLLFTFPTDHQSRPYQSLSSHPLKHQIQRKTQEQLNELVKTQLPQYMIPQTITILDKIPVNENGKVDRRALISIVQSQITERASIQQPTSEVGRQMQVIWAKVLHMEPQAIGINDNFFNIGGNSIAAMKVSAAARDIGWKLSVADIFYSPTLSDLSKTASTSTSIMTKIPVTPKKGYVAQSYAQERLWFLEQLYPGLEWHLIPCAVHFRGPLQLDALASALLALEQRHETLRTTFDTIEGENIQKVHPFQPKKLRVQSIKPNSLEEALYKEQTTPFDLHKDPGWRVSMFKLADDHHVLSVVIHHIICDGWSLDVLSKELTTLYGAALHGKDPLSAIEPLSVQYSDYALWQKQQDQIDEHNRQLEPATISGRADLQEFRIEGAIYQNLQKFCRDYQATPFMVLFAVFRAAHYRLTGAEDATIGTANAGRDHGELNALIGLFVNMQCIRTRVENTTTFENLVREVQATTIASFAHQDVPFERIVSALRKERDLSRSPLVQIVFALHSQLSLAEFALEGVEAEPITPPMTSRFDLEFHLYQEKDALKGQIRFATDLFNLNTIDNLKSVFLRILEQGLASPSASIESLSLMTKEEYAKLDSMRLLEIESTNYPHNCSLVEVFQQQAAANPDKMAVRDGPTSLTYSQLDEKSNHLAQWLRRHSFAPETLVGVLASRSHLTIIAYLGVLKACLAYLPLDPTSPLSRTKVILSSVKDCRLILVGPDAEDYATQLGNSNSESITSILKCPIYANGDVQKSLTNLFPAPDNLAYVMFTSGSTGQPKGVMIQHGGILRLIENKKMVEGLPDAVNTAHMGSVTFDASTWEIYPTLLNGGTIICFSSMELLDYKTLPKAFADENIQSMFITPALLRQYLVHCPDLFRGIHTLHIGGDRLDTQDAFTTTRQITGKVFNCYGPTENTCISTYFHISSPTPENCVNGVPIGRAFPNSGAFVMDSHQQLVPLGVVGELVVTGDGLARGYIDPNHDLDRFISIKIAGKEMRAYRTGDYVRYRREDAQLEFLGRMDNQIKIRGQRLELGEIEHAMLSHKAVNEATVVVRKGRDDEASQEATIHGFITLTEDDSAAQDQVLEMLRQQLPSYMVPRTITILDKMPINSSGKIDRQALAKQRVDGRLKRPIQQQPSTEAQRQLQSIWAKVLAIEPSTIGLDDNFFLLGGSSIAAMIVAAEIQKAGYHVTVADIFKHPALCDLSNQVRPITSRVTEMFAPFSLLGSGFNKMEFLQELSSQYNIDPTLVQDAYPSTSLQEGLLSLTSKQATGYVMRAVFKLSSSVNVEKLRDAWQTVFHALPILRTRLIQHSTHGTVQVVVDEKIQWATASNLDEYLEADAKRQMGPGKPLTRYAVVQGTSGLDKWLVWTVHHALYDGWSLPLILDSVRKVYQGSKLNPGPQYQAFINYITQDHAQTTRYWKEMLDGSGCISFPTLPPFIDQPAADKSVEYSILQPRQRHSGVTTSNLVRAAWALVVGRTTAVEEVVFGATVSGRNAPVDDIGMMIAPTFATVPIRIKLTRAHSVGEYLTMVQEQATEMIPYEQTGLQRIAAVSPEAKHACRFQTLLVIQSQHAGETDVQCGIELDKDYTQGRPADTYGLVLELNIMEDSIQVSASFDSRMIEPLMVKSLLERLDNVINQLDQANSEHPLSQVVMTSSQDIKQIWDWNQTVPLAIHRCPHELIEERSKAYPASTAVCAWDGELTYGELMRLADILAHYLMSLQPNDATIIPICFEKSLWTIVAIFGVLKSGAGFVLLDPSLPGQRRQAIIQRVEPNFVLCSASQEALCINIAPEVIAITPHFFAVHSQVQTQLHSQLRRCNPTSPMYMVFTSGSTGTPKGVVVTHENYATALEHQKMDYGLTKASRFSSIASYSFDASIEGIFRPLYVGGCSCVPSEQDIRTNLVRSMNVLKINSLITIPSVLRLLSPDQVPGLRTILIGGEAACRQDVEEWWGKAKIINLYGPSECSPVTAINNSATSPEAVCNIGIGVGLVTWVVDQDDHNVLVAPGCVGELAIEGPSVGPGYFNDPEKTATAFIKDPLWLMKGAPGQVGRHGRVYKTGDLVRYNMDGSLRYIGRKDFQRKIRGQRIELGEVEHQLESLLNHPGQIIADIIEPQGDNPSSMLAVFIQKTEAQVLVQDGTKDNDVSISAMPPHVTRRLSERLPHYMVPTALFTLNNMPKNASGKTDRQKLRQIGASFTNKQLAEMQTALNGSKKLPRSQKERQIQEIWASTLGIDAESIGLDDSFVHLGGNSITAMKVSGEARKYGIELRITDIFGHQTLRGVAEQASVSKSCEDTIPCLQQSGQVEQSFAQERLWFLDQLHSNMQWYMMPLTFRLRGPLQYNALEAALQAIERRHDTLRTTFESKDGINMQLVHAFQPRKLKVTEIPSSNQEHLSKMLEQELTRPFDLGIEPGWRVTLFKCSDDDHVLSIVMHHIISDGWSVDVLERDLAAFYSAALRDDEDPTSSIGPLPIQYTDYSVWQKQQDQVESHQHQLNFWVEHLQSSVPAELLCDKPRPQSPSGAADIHDIRIDGTLYHGLQVFSKLHGVTPFAVLLAAFRISQYRLTGATDATIGIPNANRNRWEVKDLIGFFVNMQCIRTVINGQSFESLVSQVRDEMLLSFANQEVPFEKVVASLEKDRDLSRHPLVQIVFALHSQRDLGKLKLESIDAELIAPVTTTRFDLEFHFFQEDEALQGQVIFSTDLYYKETISNMITIFRTILELGIASPTMTIDSMPLLRDNGLLSMKQLGLSHIMQTDYPRDSSIIDVFSKQVVKQGNKVAVKDSTSQLSYTELDEKSTMLASWLARRALAPETLVGVLADRSCLTIVAFLGIIKANLAYLPLDTRTPAGRMETILSSIPGRRLVLLGPGVARPTLSLPSTDLELVSIEQIIDEMTQMEVKSLTLARQPSATSLAYVMFTSGSTGLPKGVMIEHRSILRTAEIVSGMQHLLPDLVIAHASNIAFDASTWEIYTPLLNGGTVICLSHTTLLDSRILRTVMGEERIQALCITPALLKQHLLHRPLPISQVEVLYVVGDRLDPRDIATVKSLTQTRIVNGYGPTENTTFSTLYEITDDELMTNGVPIGRPLRNSGAYVVDSQLQLVPLGVIGELLVTGDGLARGYLDTQQNLGRFVSFQINGEITRAYLTGDYVRYRSDGQLEYIGRKDGQIKIRGQRVELGEIEHAMRIHKSVDDAVAVLTQQDGGDAIEPQIAGYVTLRNVDDGEAVDDTQEHEQVKEWEERFDVETYEPLTDIHPEQLGRDFVGWTSMYDGENIDETEMNEWLNDTMDAILGSNPAEHVLEIGSGSGMILFNLTDTLKSYVGLDPSERAVNMISSHLKSFPALKEKTKIYKATAADVNRLEVFAETEFVIFNSVVQYFPSQDYLFKVIQNLIGLGAIKTIFLGDIRSYALHKDFLASRALHLLGGRATPEEVARIISDMERAESELLVDPAFFTALPNRLQGIKHVEILPKKMHATNELSCYRYAAILHLTLESEREVVEIEGDKCIDFETLDLNAEALKKLLQDPSSPSILPVANIPNAKTVLERHIIASLSNQTRNETSSWLSSVYKMAAAHLSLSAIELATIAQDSGYQVEISWARQHSQRGGFDAVFYRDKSGGSKTKSQTRRLFRFPTDHLDRPYHSFTSHPLKHYLRQKIQDEIKELVQSQLPHYMVPHVITVIDQMPLNENGKVDRRSLVKSMPTQRQRAIAQPTSDNEREMQRIWADVLNIAPESIGTNDSFFFLGGSSIAAMKVVAGAGRAGYELSVADIFRTPKLGELVSCGFQRITKATKLVKPFELFKDLDISSFKRNVSKQCQLQPAKIVDAYPCTPLQEGLLALTSKRQGDYVMQAVFNIQPGVVVEKLRQAWETVYKALPLLRTRIVEHVDLGIVQVVIDESLPWVEATSLEEYLETLRELPMGIGQPLSAFAVVSDTTGTPKWLVCTMHHALYDGWSLSLIMDAVGKAYRDKQIELGSQFQAFIKFIKEQDEAQTINYWETSLKGYDTLPFPALPSSVTEARTDTFVEHTIPLPQTRSDITTSNLIRAAWALVISRMTNTKDVVFGAIVSGRNAPVSGIDTLAAPTFAAVPICINYSPTQHVSAYLKTVQQQATDMIPFEQFGLSRISHTSPGAKAACNFQTILVIQPEEMSDIPDILGKPQNDSHDTQRSDPYGISLQVQLGQERILVSVGYDSRVIEPWMIDRLLAQLQSAMHQLDCASPSQTLSEVDLATPEDLEQIWKWNGTVPPPAERCIHDIVEDRVIQSPTAEAICAWDGTLTYEELSRLSTKLAVHLLSLEVGPNMTIPLFFEKSMWTTVSMLGVLKTGAAFALLDHSIPDERLRAMLSKITAKLMLSSKALQSSGSKLAPRVLAIGSAFFANLPEQPQNLPSSPFLSSPMYTTFTSGSTGTPKGVVISHGAFSSAVHYQSDAMGYDSSTRAYDFTGYAFDVGIGTAFMTLASGGCLCVPSDADRKNNLTASVVATKANHLDLTPSVARTLQRERLVDLKVLVLGGEVASHGDFQGWPKGVSILNLYGPCECTPTSTVRRYPQDNTNPSNIGFGMGTVTWITDPDNSQRLSPIGAIGELVLEGPLVGLGYLGEPEKTKSAFVNDPAWLLHGTSGTLGRKGRLYKTGDLVRYSSDGSLVFVGRKDTQVKIHGQRVELGEIEERLRDSVPNLKDVAVEAITRDDGAPSDRLVAFISFDERCEAREDGYGKGVTENFKTPLNACLIDLPQQVEDLLSASLPGYMIPTAYFALDHIPTTHSGKADRRLLRKIGSTLTATPTAESCSVPSDLKRAPATEIERLLHTTWAQFLGIEPHTIGVDDSFFRLGGDSILAMRISAIARTEGIDISASDIFQEKTIAKIAAAARVQELKQGSSSSSPFSSPEAIRSVYKRLPPHIEVSSVNSIEDVLPCIAIQERMLEARARNPQIYVTELGLEIRSRDNDSVEFRRIQQAWQTVVRHHSLLRAVFVRRSPEEGGSYQIVLKDPAPSISLLRQEFKRSARNKQFTGASFSESSLQHHLSVYQTDETRAYLHFKFNHALADGQSFDILVRDFLLAYDNRLETHFLPYSRFLQYVMTQSHEHEKSRHHWANYMNGIEPCLLPASTQPAIDPRGTFSIDFTDLDAKKITNFCTEREVSLANILQVAWALVLRRWTGSRAPCFGNIVSARDVPVDGVDEMMGPLFYLMPSHVQLDDACAVLDILQNTREEFVQNAKHQAYSVTQLLRDLGARGSDKMFNTALSIARHTSVLQETCGGHTFEVRDAFDPVEYAVYIRGALGDGCVYLSLEFWEEHTSRADGRKMAAELGKATSLIVSHPERDIQSLVNSISSESMEFIGKSIAQD
ncbi:AMP-binding enzyme [Trichoderma harzianum]|uniref:AMP-binding enzyme n=1 Tax=Trichoderma harzianum TaxID=5544 RepID=A0A0G0A9K7_TRIHA|nr:AMP-binding enzyme [Trichoderma harzianum]